MPADVNVTEKVATLSQGGDNLGSLSQEFDRWLAAHDREVAAKALREAADEVRREARWAYEQQMRGRAVRPVERLNVVEQTLRDRADRMARGER